MAHAPSQPSRAASGSLLQLIGYLSEPICALARTVILARILSPDDLGLAIALTLTYSFIEISSDFGLERFVLRIDHASRDNAARDTLHLLSLVRSLFVALVIAATAPWVAGIFGRPEAWPYFTALSLAALLRAFSHLGIKEVARHYAFGAEATVIIATQLAWTGVTAALLLYNAHYSAVIYGIIAGQAAYTATSHQMSSSQWRLRLSRPVAREAVAFGLPFLPNAMSVAAKTIGDRLLLAALTSPVSLAVYSLITMVAVMPRGVILKLISAQFIPRLLNEVGAPRKASQMLCLSILIGLCSAFGGFFIIVFGAEIVGLLFGKAYLPSAPLVCAVALSFSIKISYSIIAIVAIANAQTRLLSYGTIANVAGMALGAAVLAAGWPAEGFVTALNLVDLVMIVVALAAGRESLPRPHRLVLMGGLMPSVLVGLFATAMLVAGIVSIWIKIGLATGFACIYAGAWFGVVARLGIGWRELIDAFRKPPQAVAPVPPRDDEPVL